MDMKDYPRVFDEAHARHVARKLMREAGAFTGHYPTRTYKWGAFEIEPEGVFGLYCWFKTRKEAVAFAKRWPAHAIAKAHIP